MNGQCYFMITKKEEKKNKKKKIFLETSVALTV